MGDAVIRAIPFSRRLAEFQVKWRWLLLLIGLAFALVASAGIKHLTSQSDYRAFLGEDNADLALSDWLVERKQGPGETLALIYKPQEGSIFTPDAMLQFGIVTAGAAELPHVRSASSVFDQRKPVAIDARYDDPGAWREAPLATGLRLTDENDLERLEDELLSTDLFSGRTTARDGSGALVTLVAELPDDDQERLAALAEIEAGLNGLRSDMAQFREGDSIALTGPPLFARTSQEVLRNDARWLAPTAFLLIVAITWLLLRNVLAVAAVSIVAILTLAATVGLAGHFGIPMTLLSASGLLLVATLAVLDTLHLVATGALKRQEGMDSMSAASESLDRNLWPMVATSLTDAAGYLALLFSASAAIQGLGLTVAIGAIAALVLSLTLLPCALPRLLACRPGMAAHFAARSERLGHWTLARPRQVLLGTAVALAIALPGLASLQLGDRMQRWFAADTDFAMAMTELESQYYGLQGFSYALRLGQADAEIFADTEDGAERRKVHAAFDREIRAIGGVERWMTVGAMRDQLLGLPQGSGRFSITPEEVQQIGENLRPMTNFALARHGLMTMPDPGRIDFFIGQADVDDDDDRAAIALAEKAEQLASRHFPESEFRIGGIGLAFAKLSDTNFRGLAAGTAATLGVVFLAMIAATGSLRAGAVAMIPNVLPIILAFGLWGWLVGEANLAIVAVVAVALGLVVDDTLHVFLKYRRGRADGLAQEDAIASVMRLNGPALLTTTLVLMAGFGTLAFSDFLLSAQKSALITVTLLLALASDLLLSPLLLRLAYPSTSNTRASA